MKYVDDRVPLGAANGDEQPASLTRRRVQIACAMMTLSIVGGLESKAVLLPAFERDVSLGWTAETSALANTLFSLLVTVGLVLAGPLADHYQPSSLLAMECALVAIGVACMCVSAKPWMILVCMGVPSLAKGVVWPALGAMASANLPKRLQDEVFSTTALGCRLGAAVVSLFLGSCMESMGWGWRHSAGALLVLLIAAMWCGLAITPCSLVVHRDTEFSFDRQAAKAKGLMTSLDGWLALLTLAGSYPVFALASYLPLVLCDTYNLDPGTAARASSVFSMGCIMGLLTSTIASSALGAGSGRLCHVFQGVVGVSAAALLSLIPVSFHCALGLTGLMGFGFVPSAYLPSLIFVAKSPPTERAFRFAMLDATGSCVLVGTTALFGVIRTNKLGLQALHSLFGITACALSVAILSMVALYWRLPVSDREEDSESTKLMA